MKYTKKRKINKRILKKKRTNKRKTNKRNIKKKQIGGEDLSIVSCLTHGTSLGFFSKILDNNYIVPNPGDPVRHVLGYDETFNKGAFFSLILKCNESKTINPLCANDVILVFSKKYIKQISISYF